MKTPRQPPQPNNGGLPAKTSGSGTVQNPLDEALDESFPASDPVAISITAIEPGGKDRPAAGNPRQGQ
ncbi:MAG TPA: hypothetical protein VF774_13065 [Pseudoduganella sp.]|jgi:hypothetical protein